MPRRRAISRSLDTISADQSWVIAHPDQPKPTASRAQAPYSPAWTISFLGTQPTLTQVPPQYVSSAIATARAVAGGDARAAHAAAAAAYDEKVEIIHAGWGSKGSKKAVLF